MGECVNKELCTWHYCRQNKKCYLAAVENGDQSISVVPLNAGKNAMRRLKGIKKKKSSNASKNYKRNKKIRIFKKTNGKCYLYQAELTLETMTIDHFIPKSKRGSNSFENLFPACAKCNRDKSNTMPL